ncbi:hypothetical protein M569_14254, partial [Genlisea aurea]
ISFLVFFFTASLLFVFFFFNKNDSRNRPPAPRKLPIVGHLHLLLTDLPHRALLSLSRKFGDPMLLQLGSIPTLVISSPETAREIFKDHDAAFSGRPSLYAVNRLFGTSANITFSPYGDYWREIRKIAVMDLFTPKRVGSFAKIRAEEVASLMGEIGGGGNSPAVDLSYLAFRLSNAVVSRVVLGTDSRDGYESRRKFQGIISELQRLAAGFNVADYFPGMGWVNKINGVDRGIDGLMGIVDEFLNGFIAEHRDRKRKPDCEEDEDLIDTLLRIQNDPKQTLNLTDQHVKAVIFDIFVAGTDTSSSTIVWTTAELMRNSESRTKLQEELRRVGKKASIGENDLSDLKYLKLVVKESLRVHPPAPLLVRRETTKPCTIAAGKYRIPAKTRVIVNAAALSMDEEYWEKPELFWPERFLDSDVDFRGQHFGFLPFGAGRRGCPGINFAVPLVELAVANLFFRYDWEFPMGMTAEDLNMEEKIGLTMAKKVPLVLIP